MTPTTVEFATAWLDVFPRIGALMLIVAAPFVGVVLLYAAIRHAQEV